MIIIIMAVCSQGSCGSLILIMYKCVYQLSQDLNHHLSGRIFISGYKLCVADILLYYGLHRYMVGWLVFDLVVVVYH